MFIFIVAVPGGYLAELFLGQGKYDLGSSLAVLFFVPQRQVKVPGDASWNKLGETSVLY